MPAPGSLETLEHLPHWMIVLLFIAGGPIAVWAIGKKILWPLMGDVVLALMKGKSADVAVWLRSEDIFGKDIATSAASRLKLETLERLCSSNADAITALAAAQLQQGESLRRLPGIAATLVEVSRTMRELNGVARGNAEDIGELRGMIAAISPNATPGRRHRARRATDPQPADDGEELLAPEEPSVE